MINKYPYDLILLLFPLNFFTKSIKKKKNIFKKHVEISNVQVNKYGNKMRFKKTVKI